MCIKLLYKSSSEGRAGTKAGEAFKVHDKDPGGPNPAVNLLCRLQEEPAVPNVWRQEGFLWDLEVLASCLSTQRADSMRSGGCWSRVQTLVWRQLWEEPAAAAAPGGEEGSSSLESLRSSLWRPRLMWLCRAAGVSHSLGRQLCRKGMQELK